MACGAGQAGGHTMFQQRPLWNFGSAWHIAAAPLAPAHSVLEELQDFCTRLVYNPLLVLSLMSVWALFWGGQWWPYLLTMVGAAGLGFSTCVGWEGLIKDLNFLHTLAPFFLKAWPSCSVPSL